MRSPWKSGFTPSEWAALAHRLEVPDALADVLDDYCPDDVHYVCECLLAGDWRRAVDHSTQLVDDVLVDCVEGSTWVGCASQETPQRLAAARRTLASLAKKIELMTGRRINVPYC